MSQNAQLVLGAALAQAGKRQEAIDTYLKLAKHADLAFMKRNALNQAALLREQAGDWKGAAELYTQMLDGLDKGTAERQIAEMRLAEVQARAGAAPAAK